MTKPVEYDFFPLHFLGKERFYTVLLEAIILETVTDDVTTLYKRGIYAFLSKTERNTFTKSCNGDKQDDVAINYNRKSNKD